MDVFSLSQRQLQILRLISEGMTNQEIADKMFISKRTAEGNRATLLNMTGTKNTAALITFGFRYGILL